MKDLQPVNLTAAYAVLLLVLLSSLAVVSQAVRPNPSSLSSSSCSGSSSMGGHGRTDFRSVTRNDLLPGMHRFSDVVVDEPGHFTEMLVDIPRYQLIVGGRDALFRLSLDGLTRLEKAEWAAKSSAVNLCTAKGQSDENCRNYVKVLTSHGDQVFACGTNAFSPKCSWRAIEEINRVNKWIDGRGKCPHSPTANSTAFMLENGDYYIGSSTDFSSNDYAIYRMSGPSLDTVLRTVQYNSLWLAQPDFVGSFETDKFVYFVLRETAVEHMNCGKAIYSRIARICKDDRGGNLVLKNNWTTFLKARLNCFVPGEYPFYYNEVQSVAYLPTGGGVVYATFTTGESAIAGSAVCSFNVSAIDLAFAGPFKSQAHADSSWLPVNDDHSQFQCDKGSAKHLGGVNSREYQFLNDAVQPEREWPMFYEHLERYTHIAVEAVATKHQDNYPVHVIFVATSEGTIKKLSHNTRNGATCLVEILRPFEQEASVIRNMILVEATSSLYLATQESILQIPTQRCQRFGTEKQCRNAMDPYCGWSKQKEECTATPNKNPRAVYFQQDPLTCPVLSDPLDGGWSIWSNWIPCDLTSNYTPDKRPETSSSASSSQANDDLCMCRRRSCDNPLPSNGGTICVGKDVEVSNCTTHGQWTLWSDWSGCSKTCDIGMRQRKRICGNPSPAFGGRVCVGRDIDSQYCTDLPPCDATAASASSSSLSPPVAQIAVSFSEWSGWSKCSAECGTGFKRRTRKCVWPGDCSQGSAIDFKECEEKRCPEILKYTDWTPWIKGNNGSEVERRNGWYERRFSFSYQTLVTATPESRMNEEERFCKGENECSLTSDVNHSLSTPKWTEWSACTRECGGGYQIRAQMCSGSDCGGGMAVTERSCNTRPCLGQWGCWTDWSECDSGLKRRRQRECESQQFIPGSDVTCQGGSSYEEMDCADGAWMAWGEWGECDGEGSQTRHRTCTGSEQCVGDDVQKRPCGGGCYGSGEAAATRLDATSISIACVIGFLLGGAAGAALAYFFLVIRPVRGLINGVNGGGGSPHYVSAKSQNLYVSLPMLDLKHKHFSSDQSDCGTMRSTTTAGTLRSKASVGGGSSVFVGGRPSDYETATIKRSHSQRNSSLLSAGNIRADLDSDQLFT